MNCICDDAAKKCTNEIRMRTPLVVRLKAGDLATMIRTEEGYIKTKI